MTNTGGVPATQRDGGILRPLLWAVLAIGVVGNICFSGAACRWPETSRSARSAWSARSA